MADHLQRVGHQVTLAANDPNSESVKEALAKNANLKVAVLKDAVRDAEVVFLATPFEANESALKAVANEIPGKILVDCTNPVGPNLSHGLNNVQSGSEMVQALLPDTKVVKTFTIYGFENFEDSAYPGYNVKPVNDVLRQGFRSKEMVEKLIAQLLASARCRRPGAGAASRWVRMVRVNGRSPNMVWAALFR